MRGFFLLSLTWNTRKAIVAKNIFFMKNLFDQLDKVAITFGKEILIDVTNFYPILENNGIPLVVVPSNIIPTEEIFAKIDLGCMQKNTWFLDSKHMYDIVRDIPHTPYLLPNVSIGSSVLVPNNYTSYDFNGPRPLTFHEIVTLAFQVPSIIFNERIIGIQAYGSRFANSKGPARNPDRDDTLEIYRKGNHMNGFLKLAREYHRYHEDTKIIPWVEVFDAKNKL